MNRKDQNLISNIYMENINQFGAKSASKEEMASMLAKHVDYQVAYDEYFSQRTPEAKQTFLSKQKQIFGKK